MEKYDPTDPEIVLSELRRPMEEPQPFGEWCLPDVLNYLKANILQLGDGSEPMPLGILDDEEMKPPLLRKKLCLERLQRTCDHIEENYASAWKVQYLVDLVTRTHKFFEDRASFHADNVDVTIGLQVEVKNIAEGRWPQGIPPQIRDVELMYSPAPWRNVVGSLLEEIRGRGWAVAVHNDYKQERKDHTFWTYWLFTKGTRCIKGEGLTDEEALLQVAKATHPLVAPSDVPPLNLTMPEVDAIQAQAFHEQHDKEFGAKFNKAVKEATGMLPGGLKPIPFEITKHPMVCSVCGLEGGCTHLLNENAPLSKEDFTRIYCERSGITPDQMEALGLSVKPCSCGEEGCRGWEMSSKKEGE